ncbi:hypothetical protein GCM10025868_42280 [Angustibacter aerolatus]|uniref:Uncharacterized protein n=1 Tax=Angustibacter aerolatus TaxID=1162965 RepID=A0ABQ6JL86_9ACTN|nr:hypothetical protein GCM10025868_42280 [Angustibacter aerolatus]
MPPLPAPGTFRLYPFAQPPLAAGPWTVTGEVSGLPGPVEPLQAAVDVRAPRYALPPDQVLSTYPPATSEGAFGTRLPQVVLRRRTIPWERSQFTGGTPVPWLALVLVADGEGSLLHDVPVGQCSTVPLTGAVDVPKGSASRCRRAWSPRCSRPRRTSRCCATSARSTCATPSSRWATTTAGWPSCSATGSRSRAPATPPAW